MDEFAWFKRFGTAVSSPPDGRERRDRLFPLGDAGKLQRVRERLPPVRERPFDNALELGESDGKRAAAEREQRRVDIRLRPEDGPRDGVEPGSLGGELDEHRDGAVRLGSRATAKKRSATSRCSITHHRSTAGRPVRLSAISGVAMLYGRFATSFRGGGSSAARSRRSASPKTTRTLSRADDGPGELRLERAVDLDGVDEPDPIGEEHRQRHAESRPDLEDDVVGLELGQPADHAEDVRVGEEVLAEGFLRCCGHKSWVPSPKAAVAFRSI